MANELQVQEATASDYCALSDVMFDAVRNGRSRYTEDQRRAWVPHARSGPHWIERLNAQTVFLATRSGDCVGFMSLAEAGYIDFAYVRPSAQGTGVFSVLLHRVEELAANIGEHRLWVHASLMAEPAFSAKGFTILKREVVVIGDQSFDRFEMEKLLNGPFGK